MTGKVYIGTSGWNYQQWKNGFYASVPRKDWLRYNASRFSGLEINASFYRLPNRTLTERWYAQTPDAFRFAVKGSRFITHNKKLIDPIEPLKRQRACLAGLKHKLVVMLWQLPRASKKNLPRLRDFAKALDDWPQVRHVLEFRDVSWFDDEVAGCLAHHKLAVCLSDAADWPLWERITADLIYIRLHGHTRTYASAYSPAALNLWAARIRGWLAEKRDVHVYFDNDAEGAAPFDALKLMTRVEPQRLD